MTHPPARLTGPNALLWRRLSPMERRAVLARAEDVARRWADPYNPEAAAVLLVETLNRELAIRAAASRSGWNPDWLASGRDAQPKETP